MENIIMPELITPAFKEILDSEPELLEHLLSSMEGKGEVKENRRLELDEDNLPSEMKLLFCNVNIRINNSAVMKDAAADNCCGKRALEALERLEDRLQEKRSQLDELKDEVDNLKEKVLIDEIKLREYERTLKILCKVPLFRKMSSRYKLDIRELQNGLKRKRLLMEERMQLLECAVYEKNKMEKGIRTNIRVLLDQLFQNG